MPQEMGSIMISTALICLLIGAGLTLFVLSHLNKRSLRQEREHNTYATNIAQQDRARRIRQAQDTQVNLGRQAYGLIEKYLEPHRHLGFEVWRIEDNGGGGYYIQVVHWYDRANDLEAGHILQLSINCVKLVGKDDGPTQLDCNNAHVHYGKYGHDAYFRVDNQLMKGALRDLVLDRLDKVIEREQQNYAARLARTAS